jgi:hypothetical protein
MKLKIPKLISNLKRDTRGSMLIFILIFGSVATVMVIGGVATYGIFENQVSVRKHDREVAFHIAEAGVEYYRWHLAHAPTDFQDGTGVPGPYVHDFKDKNGVTIGYYSLAITPPLAGSTVVTVKSTGWTVVRPEIKRTVQIRLGYPSLTDYTFLSNASMDFSLTSSVNGPIHSNGGIHFMGTTDSWVRSAKDRYLYQPPNQWRNGIWGGGGPKSFWQYPVPAIDFVSVSADLAALRTLSDNGGVHLTSSGDEGWHIVFNNSTYDLYRVNSRLCYHRRPNGWYCYDIRNETLVSSNNPIPSNGAFFIEDDTWVDGVVDGRVSIGVGRFPVLSPYKKIFLNGNITISAHGGDDVLGLMAQGDIVVPHDVPDNMTVEAAMLSQFGTIHRPHYRNHTRSSLTVFGSQIYFTQGGMKWTNGFGNIISGFINTTYIYDGNLRYYPPPSFPVSNTYELISWEEVE